MGIPDQLCVVMWCIEVERGEVDHHINFVFQERSVYWVVTRTRSGGLAGACVLAQLRSLAVETIERLCVVFCRFWHARAGRESWVFVTGVPGRTILLRQDLLTQCRPLPPTVHMVVPSLPLTSAWRVDSVACYWIDQSAEARMRCQRRLWRRVVIEPCRATFLWKLHRTSWNYSSVTDGMISRQGKYQQAWSLI